MTTKSVRPVTRETSALVRDKGLRCLIVTVVGATILLRAKGLRSTEVLDLSWCYLQAVKQRVASERAERAKSRQSVRQSNRKEVRCYLG